MSIGTGMEVRFDRALVGGETGANLFTAADGGAWVIKWVDAPASIARRREAVEVSERLRLEAAWPTPHRRHVSQEGWLFVLQEYVPGSALETLTAGVVEVLLAAHERRLELVPEWSSAFADHLLETLAVGAASYCLHDPMRRHSRRGARFVDRVEEVARETRAADLPASDLIHWDLHPGNLVVDDGRLVGVIDCDHAKAGDGVVDLVCLAMSAWTPGTDVGILQRLEDEVITPLDDLRSAAYVGHYALRFGDWAVRHGRDAEVAMWLDIADAWM